jgi:hypothetical protein
MRGSLLIAVFQIVKFLPSNDTPPRVDCAFQVSGAPKNEAYCLSGWELEEWPK